MRDFLKKRGAAVIAIGVLLLVILCVISVFAVFGGFIMKFFGFEYRSVWNIILFFGVATVISYPISVFAEAIPKVLHYEFKKITLLQAKMLYLPLDTFATFMGLSIVDYFMNSVKASNIAVFAVSLVFAILSVKTLEEKGQKKEVEI